MIGRIMAPEKVHILIFETCDCVTFLTFSFILAYNQLTMLWWFQGHSRATQLYKYMCPFSPKLPSPLRLPHNTEQSSLCYTVGPCWLSILNMAVCTAPAAAAKLLQSCPTLCNPIGGSPPGSPVPGILQARTLEWVAISFSNAGKWKVKVKLLSHVRLFVTPWTAAYQAPPSMGFSRQEYRSGVPLPCPPQTL